MKKRLQMNFLAIAAVSILTVLLLTSIVLYNLFQEEVMENLQVCAYVLETDVENVEMLEQAMQNIKRKNDIRVTIIDPQGNVLSDSKVESHDLENHQNRPEVQGAIEKGEGKAIRTSSTLSKASFYYAVKMKSGNILRLSKESQSFLSFLIQISPFISGIAIILFFVCMLLSRLLARSIVRPIETLACNMGSGKPVTTYKELTPFITTIQEQHEDIVKSSQMRQEFTANVSHELKTPLTSISGYSELIENGMAKGEDAVRFAGEIHTNANRLLTLINDILQLSELDDRDFSDDFTMVNVSEIIDKCVELLTLNAKKHDVSLVTQEVPEKVMVKGSPKMLEELIYNLIDNGIRYNKEKGTVYIRVEEQEHTVQLRVVDTGIGISKEHQERIFERFYRVDKSRSKATGGTGLGLAIVKHIVVCHKATIEVHSKEGEGTELVVTFQKTDD